MLRTSQVRIHELEFCGDVKSYCDALFRSHPDWPFNDAKIEQYGAGNYKRNDLRFYQRGSQTPVLCGEVKMPGTPEGRSPYDDALMRDAFEKADNIQCPYFFTWNVNKFVLFDRSKWHELLEELYRETSAYYRYQRTQDIQSMENRAPPVAPKSVPATWPPVCGTRFQRRKKANRWLSGSMTSGQTS